MHLKAEEVDKQILEPFLRGYQFRAGAANWNQREKQNLAADHFVKAERLACSNHRKAGQC